MTTATKPKKSAVTAALEGIRDSAVNTAPETGAAVVSAVSAEFDWNQLPAPEIAVYTRAPGSKNVEENTPDVVKRAVKAAFAATSKAGKTVFLVQRCGDPERAKEFFKLARAYAAFSGWTCRGAANPEVVSVKNSLGVAEDIAGAGMIRFAVKPKEVRTPKAV